MACPWTARTVLYQYSLVAASRLAWDTNSEIVCAHNGVNLNSIITFSFSKGGHLIGKNLTLQSKTNRIFL